MTILLMLQTLKPTIVFLSLTFLLFYSVSKWRFSPDANKSLRLKITRLLFFLREYVKTKRNVKYTIRENFNHDKCSQTILNFNIWRFITSNDNKFR